MMSPRDPDAGAFAELLNDLAEVQRRRELTKALPPAQATPREFVPFSAFNKAQRIADERTTRAGIGRSLADLAAVERQVRVIAAEQAAQSAGERRARARAAIEDVMRRAMEGVAAGTVSAIEVAKLESRAHRVLASIDPGPSLRRGVA